MGRISGKTIARMRLQLEVFGAAFDIFNRTQDDTALGGIELLLQYHASVGPTVRDVATAATTSKGRVSVRYTAEAARNYMVEIIDGTGDGSAAAGSWNSLVRHFGCRVALKSPQQLADTRAYMAAHYDANKDTRRHCDKCGKDVIAHNFKMHNEVCGSGLSESDMRDFKRGSPLGMTKAKSACTCDPRSVIFSRTIRSFIRRLFSHAEAAAKAAKKASVKAHKPKAAGAAPAAAQRRASRARASAGAGKRKPAAT